MRHWLDAKKQARYLDIGCGTGNYTVAFDQQGFEFTGIDPSIRMLSEAKLKESNVHWVEGCAEEIPYPDKQFSGAIASLTIHHWSDADVGFSELVRVLCPGARLVVFTSTPEQMSGYWLNHYFPQMMQTSMLQMHSLERVQSGLLKAGFEVIQLEKYCITDTLKDLFLYSGKHRPELYLDHQFRQGISSFANLANGSEVDKGLKDLEHDISTGKIKSIMDNYNHESGDYLFIVAEKK